ncbi:GIY-YIG nuclease family protein [Flavobacterium frigidarium]|uniref:GIY-YIG nuclease family protein n=1 Tax=Flavobacterium frigidarium TaxID=99286 RepID=UPI0030DA0E22|tara:strand:+ start:1963 stop:2667 length:705 start_codon:yes stop_codon:yes gene_type:complete
MYLYFIRILGENKVKIGITTSWVKRVRNIQTGGGYPSDKMVSRSFDVEDAKLIESTLLYNLRNFKIIGEWFYDIDIVKFLFDDVLKRTEISKDLVFDILEKFNPIELKEIELNDKSVYIPEGYDFTCYLKELTKRQIYTIFFHCNEKVDLYLNSIFYKVNNEFYTWYYYDATLTVRKFLTDNNIDYNDMTFDKSYTVNRSSKTDSFFITGLIEEPKDIVEIKVKKVRPMKRIQK